MLYADKYPSIYIHFQIKLQSVSRSMGLTAPGYD